MEKNNETLSVLRHSCSHIMAQAVQKLFPQAKLAIGPSTDSGFYYDFDLTDGYAFTQEDLVKIEEEMKNIIKQNLTFEKYFVEDVDEKIAEFKAEGEIYKAELLEEHRNDNPTLYLTKDKDGNVLFNDLCAGPHIPNTSYIKGNAIKLLKVAGAYGLLTKDDGRELLDFSPLGGEEGAKILQSLNNILPYSSGRYFLFQFKYVL